MKQRPDPFDRADLYRHGAEPLWFIIRLACHRATDGASEHLSVARSG